MNQKSFLKSETTTLIPNCTNVPFTSDASGYVKFWHYTSRTSLAKIDEERQTLSCAWNPMGSGFITCGADPQIIKYDAETKQQIRVMEPR